MKSKRITLLLILTICAAGAVFALYTLSEKIVHHRNNFIRRYPHHVAELRQSVDLQVNSYYIAGTASGRIFLGNSTTPLRIIELDSNLQILKKHRVIIDGRHPFRSPHVRINGSQFYLYEGLAPAIYSGNTYDWRAFEYISDGLFFSLLQPTDADTLAVRYFKAGKGENLLGATSLSDETWVQTNPSLLQKQVDGVIDTDGILIYDDRLEQVIYVYLYRNEFIVVNRRMKLLYRGKTIDTISRANLRLKPLSKGKGLTFSEPPLIVNKYASADNGLLFINSLLPGQFESDELWKSASIIDVYDLRDGSYRSSFPVYNIGKQRLNSFIVRENRLYALIGQHIAVYWLGRNLTAKTKNEREDNTGR